MNRSSGWAGIGIALLVFAGFALTSSAASARDSATDSPDRITGVWQTKTGGYVQIYQNGDTYAGEIVGSTDGKPRYDHHNPDKSQRDKRLLGQNILQGLKYTGDGAYESGTIYDPNNGKQYKAKAQLTGPDTLEARGYIGISLIGKSQTWHRIDPQSPHVHQELLHKPVGQSPATAG